MRSLLFFLAVLPLTISPAWTGSLTSILALPNQPAVRTMQQDAAGNHYIAGSVDSGGFVAKLASDGGTVQFWTQFSSSGVGALALAPDGSILIAGSTTWANFSVTPDAAEPQSTAGAGNATGFFARLDANGNVVYATYLNGSSLAAPQFSPGFLAMTTDATGNAYITGQGLFDSTPGALPLVNYYSSGFSIIKLDATGKIVFTTGAVGGPASRSIIRASSMLPAASDPVIRCQ
jgi:hypothetical protein